MKHWAAVVLLACLAGCAASPTRREVLLCAGDWTEDFRFLPPRAYGIAYPALTIAVENGQARAAAREPVVYLPLEPRALHAVVRIRHAAPSDARWTGQAAAAIAQLGAVPRLSAILIDYDAPPAQRASYAALLRAARLRLPRAIELSVAAPPNWCSNHSWIPTETVNALVPMLFREPAPPGGLHTLGDCAGSVGVMAADAAPEPARRVYVWADQPWDPAALAACKPCLRE